MTLLIVDDQSQVVKGILSGVNWAEEGFDEVFAAYNAAEARRVLDQHAVDVMLCDIEMPVESGLSLVEWMRAEGMQTRCIFLTSHMSFEYAQRALRLGIADYLVLPAPYPDIRNAVRKAAEELQADRAQEKLDQYSQLVQRREDAFVEGLLHSYVTSGEAAGLADAQRLGYLPADDTPCYLVLVQVLRQEGGQAVWDPKSLRYAISNITAELYAAYGQKCYCVDSDATRLCYLVYGEGYNMDFEGVVRQLESLIQLGGQYLNCLLACYTDTETRLRGLPGLYTALWQRSDDNVAMRSKVFFSDETADTELSGTLSQTMFSRMRQALVSGHIQAVREESTSRLQHLLETEQINAKNLELLYKWTIQLFNQSFAELGLSLQQVYPDTEAFTLYHEGGKSIEHLRRLFDTTLDRLEVLVQREDEQGYSVQQVIAYIHDHLEEDIRRSELAAHFHLNPDYLTRVFKKETGQTLKEFITAEKITVAQGLLRTTSLPVGMIAAKVGFSSLSHFSRVYQKTVGRTPTEERNVSR